MKPVYCKEGWQATIERLAMDKQRVVEMWIKGQQTPVRGLVAYWQNADNHKMNSGFEIDGAEAHQLEGDHYRYEELRAPMEHLGVSITIKVILVEATDNPPEGCPFFYITSEHDYPPENGVAHPWFFNRLLKTAKAPISKEWADWLWCSGFEDATWSPSTKYQEANIVAPIQRIEADGMYAYKISTDYSLWNSVVRRHHGAVHRIYVPTSNETYRVYNDEALYRLYRDLDAEKFPEWRMQLAQDKDSPGRNAIQWLRNYPTDNGWTVIGQAPLRGDVGKAIVTAAANSGIEAVLLEEGMTS